MAFIAWLLGAGDVLLTSYGLRLGVISELNPVMAALFNVSHALATGFSLVLSGISLAVLHFLASKSTFALQAMKAVLVLRVVIICLHAHWILASFVNGSIK